MHMIYFQDQEIICNSNALIQENSNGIKWYKSEASYKVGCHGPYSKSLSDHLLNKEIILNDINSVRIWNNERDTTDWLLEECIY